MKAQVVSFRCVLTDKLGKVISSSFNHDVLTYVGKEDGPLSGLIEGLQDLRKGEKRRIVIPAQKAYGLYDPKLVVEVSRREFFGGRAPERGREVRARFGDGGATTFRVIDVAGDRVTLDGNHPLAGQDLVFDIEAFEARDATTAEIAEASEERPDRMLH